jgi:hypothetical protein
MHLRVIAVALFALVGGDAELNEVALEQRVLARARHTIHITEQKLCQRFAGGSAHTGVVIDKLANCGHFVQIDAIQIRVVNEIRDLP